MKYILFFALFLFISGGFASKHYQAYAIYNDKGKEVDFGKLVKATESKNYVFFGEYHDNPISHWLQFELTKEMYAIHKNRLMLGAEMFEADNQYIIDEYMADQISEKNFQKEVRLWPNYNTDYKPLLEYAKSNGLSMIATNIPRRYANMVYKKGVESLADLSELAKTFIVPLDKFEFDSTISCYKNLMDEFSHGGINMAKAQAIKDATMSYFILKNKTKKTVFLHFNGAYHSDNYQGIVHYLKKEVPENQILTISTVTQNNINKLDAENQGLADFTICVSETMTNTH